MPSTGITYSHQLEFNLVAHWWGLTPDQLRRRSLFDQAEIIATYRAYHKMEALSAHISSSSSNKE